MLHIFRHYFFYITTVEVVEVGAELVGGAWRPYVLR